MVFDYENLFVIRVLFDLNLKEFWSLVIWEIFEILDKKWGVLPVFKTAHSVS